MTHKNKKIVLIIIIIGVVAGITGYTLGNKINNDSKINIEKKEIKKKYYEYCNNEDMIKVYKDSFERMIIKTAGNDAALHYVEINSKPEIILNNQYLRCKVNLSYKFTEGFDYNIGTVDLLTTVKGINERTGNVKFDFLLSGEISNQGNAMKDAFNNSMRDFRNGKYDE